MKAAGIVITEEEAKRIEYCDYHLGEFDTIGTEILTYVNTDRVCAKEMMLTPYQICPEHLHPQLGDYQGKEETFRCRWGEVYLYVPGEDVYKRQAKRLAALFLCLDNTRPEFPRRRLLGRP